MINEKLKSIICRRCDKVVAPEHLQTHVSSKHKIYCSHDTVKSIVTGRRLMSLDAIIEFRENTKQLESPIGGIPVMKVKWNVVVGPMNQWDQAYILKYLGTED
jgi:hypothetical protein